MIQKQKLNNFDNEVPFIFPQNLKLVSLRLGSMGNYRMHLRSALRRRRHSNSYLTSDSSSSVGNFTEPPQEIISELSTQEKYEVSEMVITINDYLEKAPDPTKNSARRSWTICRVPFKLKRIHAHGFDPNIISIGPFHRHKLHLKAMEEHKLRFLARLLNRMNPSHGDQEQRQNCTSSVEAVIQLGSAVSSQQQQHEAAPVITNTTSTTTNNSSKIYIECLAVAMKQLEVSTRACYSETFDHDQFGQKEFVMMMLLDGCFIVELLRLYVEWESDTADDPIFNTRWMVANLKHDLLMLENQLPFPVLKKIFEITSSWNEQFSLTDLILKFFNSLLPRDNIFLNRCKLDSQPSHLLGVFRSSFQIQKPVQDSQTKGWFSGRDSADGCLRSWRVRFPLGGILANKKEDSLPQDPSSLVINDINNVSPFSIEERRLLIHCVTELKEAGIGFKKRETHDLLDIKFKNGNLHIPPLFIDDYTGLVFLNFVAYEQCNPSTEPYITNYLLFFHSLLNSSKDVEHLSYKGIIHHVLGCDEDVAHLFHKLCREVIHNLDDCYLSKLLKDVSRYFRTKRYRWIAKWKHDNFSSPWAFFSFLAAVFLLILTAIQTFMAVFSYVTKRS